MNILTLLLVLFTKKNTENIYSGYDCRYKLRDDLDILNKIHIQYEKKYILDFISNKEINIHNKLTIIENYEKNTNEKKILNIKNGGLYNDWDFEL